MNPRMLRFAIQLTVGAASIAAQAGLMILGSRFEAAITPLQSHRHRAVIAAKVAPAVPVLDGFGQRPVAAGVDGHGGGPSPAL